MGPETPRITLLTNENKAFFGNYRSRHEDRETVLKDFLKTCTHIIVYILINKMIISVTKSCLKKYASFSLDLDSDSPYFIEDIGQTSCQNGTKIINAEGCKTACIELERNIGKMKTGNECYIAGNGRCRQAGRRGKKSSLVCVTRGNPDILQCSSAMSHNNIVLIRLDLYEIRTFSSV